MDCGEETFDLPDPPTFLRIGSPERERVILVGRELAKRVQDPAAQDSPPGRLKRRKRRSPIEIKILGTFGYRPEDIRELTISETERICLQGLSAGMWRTARAMRELKTIGT